MNALRERWAALDNEKARTGLVAAGFLIVGGLAAATFGGWAADVIFGLCVLWLARVIIGLYERAEQAAVDADRAGRTAEAARADVDQRVPAILEQALAAIYGHDEPTGRHARRKPTPYRREAA